MINKLLKVIYDYCIAFFKTKSLEDNESVKFSSCTCREFKKELNDCKNLNKSISETLADICDKYKELLKENTILSDKIVFYEEELKITQTQLIKYMEDNFKLREVLYNEK